jgi:hypothetical protein
VASGGIVPRIPMPYTGRNGASHDVVEQGFHDQNSGADHFCTRGCGHPESGKSALRFQLGHRIGGGLDCFIIG